MSVDDRSMPKAWAFPEVAVKWGDMFYNTEIMTDLNYGERGVECQRLSTVQSQRALRRLRPLQGEETTANAHRGCRGADRNDAGDDEDDGEDGPESSVQHM